MNSLDFEEIQNLRDSLIYSLKCWESPIDGFYRSAPTAILSETPSFSNTGVVLQAFNESGNKYLAQRLANRLLRYLQKRHFIPFPNEKTGTHDKPHVLCNAWAIFSILDCYPRTVHQLRNICNWFLDNKRGDNSWDLIPGEETRYPAITAYAVGTLLQFYNSYKMTAYRNNEYVNRVALAIKNGIGYLLDNRSRVIRERDLYLWPASFNDADRNLISFGTTALCIHVISNASRAMDRKEWEIRGASTLSKLISGFDGSKDVIRVDEFEINIWDQIHVNESSLNYLWAFFAPLHITTLLSFIEYEELIQNNRYYAFIEYLTHWIIDNASTLDGLIGIRGSQHIQGIKTWSTAQSAIALSQLINKKELFLLYRKMRDTVPGNSDEYSNLVQEIYNQIHSYHDTKLWKNLRKIGNGLILVIAGVVFWRLYGYISSNWSSIEGPLWLGGTVFSLTLLFLGVNRERIRDKITTFIFEILYSKKIVKEIGLLILRYRKHKRS